MCSLKTLNPELLLHSEFVIWFGSKKDLFGGTLDIQSSVIHICHLASICGLSPLNKLGNTLCILDYVNQKSATPQIEDTVSRIHCPPAYYYQTCSFLLVQETFCCNLDHFPCFPFPQAERRLVFIPIQPLGWAFSSLSFSFAQVQF